MKTKPYIFGILFILVSFTSMSQTLFHPAASRGHADHGWLNTHHSFSFANWHNPERMHFGALRVLNDDQVAAGRGFGRHPHDNMEIISIPLSGSLRHEDSMGNVAVIEQGDVQIMSAGTGVIHAEHNHSDEEGVDFLQIWIFPNARDLKPRYDQQSFSLEDERNQWKCVVSPLGMEDDGVQIHQNAWLHLGTWSESKNFRYTKKRSENGVYAFVLEGSVQLQGESLGPRDAMGIIDSDTLDFASSAEARVLLLEVPMQW